MDMLAQWVTKRRWRGDDDSGSARARLAVALSPQLWTGESGVGPGGKDEQPFKAVRPRSLRSNHHEDRDPESYQVVWHEVRVDSKAASLKEQDYIGTFTVGRVRPKDLTEAMDNRLGLCVSGYDIAPKAGS